MRSTRAPLLLTIGSVITIGFGVWHLFVPTIWDWYSYFPREAHELVVAVRAINVFFSVSLVLFGAVMLVFVHRRPSVVFYTRAMAFTLALLWGLRVVLQLVWPQGSMSPALQYGMLGTFALVFLLFAASAILLRES